MFDELLGKENVSEVVKAPEISSKAKNKFSNFREKFEQEISKRKQSTQHSIEITPELKAAVKKGQPLFKEAEAQYRIKNLRTSLKP